MRAINGKILTREIKDKIFLRYGVCDIFISDNGSEFENEVGNKLLVEYGAEHAGHARANTVERTNRVIKP